MSKEELIKRMATVESKYTRKNRNGVWYDNEAIHVEQDRLLLKFINDSEITDLFNRTAKWYS